MFLSAHGSSTSCSIHLIKCLKQILTPRKSAHPSNRILNVSWNGSAKSIIIPKFIKHQLFIVLPFFIFRRVNYSQMNNITDLADLAVVDVQQDSCKQCSGSITNLNMEFSESESSSSSHEEMDISIPLEKVPYQEDYYQHSFDISKNHYKHIVGTNGTILQRLSSETKTIIRVSKKKKHVVIIGSIQKRIFHAKHKINKLIENSQHKPQFTHFISVPTTNDEIKSNFVEFKKGVIQNYKTEFDERMFQKPEKLHLTISMLHLLDQKDEERAIASLNTCKENLIDPILKQNGPITIELRGIKCMEKDPSKAKVLYIDVHEKTGLFRKMSDSINDHFIEQGLSRRQHSNVTLHMTVINSLYLQRKVKEAKKNFDARQLLKNYKNVCLGTVNLSTFHISMLTAKSADGYFKPISKINL